MAAIAGLFVYATLIDRGRDRRKAADHTDAQRQTLVHADPSCHHTAHPGNAITVEPDRIEENQP